MTCHSLESCLKWSSPGTSGLYLINSVCLGNDIHILELATLCTSVSYREMSEKYFFFTSRVFKLPIRRDCVAYQEQEHNSIGVDNCIYLDRILFWLVGGVANSIY